MPVKTILGCALKNEEMISEPTRRKCILSRDAGEPARRYRPDQWNCGAVGWLIDAAGEAEGVRNALRWLAAGPFKERPLKMTVRGSGGVVQVTTLGALLAERADNGGTL